MKRQTIKHLPDELISEILLANLPIKSLLRFKSVSKSWRSLISSAKFVNDHLNRSTSDSDLAHHNLMGTFYDEKTGRGLKSYSLTSLLDEPDDDDSTCVHHYPTGNADFLIWIVGSCNGLILINIRRCLLLWNPSTRKLKTVPPPSSSPPQGMDNTITIAGTIVRHSVHGFGYDDSTDDYKVVWIISYFKLGYTEIHQTKIYSVRTGSWKEIENLGKPFETEYPGIFVNGKLHWVRVREGAWDVVALSLVEGQEKHQAVATPSNYDQCVVTLGNLGGYLSLIVTEMNMVDINVWVMMKYGVAESWTNIWTFLDFDHPPIRLHFGGARPFWVTENGDIFVMFGQSSEIVVYNRESKLRDYQIGRINQPLVYVESLVSP